MYSVCVIYLVINRYCTCTLRFKEREKSSNTVDVRERSKQSNNYISDLYKGLKERVL